MQGGGGKIVIFDQYRALSLKLSVMHVTCTTTLIVVIQ